ncbi:hypothetical protein DPQ22_09220 [Candidatus Tokpelaia sp.]|nr:hypothetical protein DPQ22_09220 [Candidatus Tokpelaia sp.]
MPIYRLCRQRPGLNLAAPGGGPGFFTGCLRAGEAKFQFHNIKERRLSDLPGRGSNYCPFCLVWPLKIISIRHDKIRPLV